MQANKNIEAAFPLSPLQHGMLFHTLYATDVSVYVVQMVGVLRGGLDVPAFEAAWQKVVDHHPVLRTAFVWEGFQEPLQVVGRKVKLRIEQQDWRDRSAEEQEVGLKEFLWEDRCRGFALFRAPLMRVWLLRIADDAYRLVWSHHHLLLDGWSLPLLFNDLFQSYRAFVAGTEPELSPVRPFQEYVGWLKKQDASEAERYWRADLAGFHTPTPVLPEAAKAVTQERLTADQGYFEDLSVELTRSLGELARQHQLTLNTILQGAWGLVLGRHCGRDDVVFGSTVSGRPPNLPGSETMLGLFINTIPVRVRVDPKLRVIPWLKALQTQQIDQRRFEHTSLVDVQGWTDVPHGAPLFESLMLFENYPLDSALGADVGSVALEDFRVISTADFPLALVVVPGERLALRIGFARDRFDERSVAEVCSHLRNVLQQWVTAPFEKLGDVSLEGSGAREALEARCRSGQAPSTPSGLFANPIGHLAAQGDTPALACGEERSTYSELASRVSALAASLRQVGAGPETVVGLDFDGPVDAVIGKLAVWAVGAAWLSRTENADWAAWAGRTKLDLLITDEARVGSFAGLGLPILTPSEDVSRGATGASEYEPGQLAAVIPAGPIEPGLVTADPGNFVGLQRDEVQSRIDAYRALANVEAGTRVAISDSLSPVQVAVAIAATLDAGGTVVLGDTAADEADTRATSARELRRLVASGWRSGSEALVVTGDWFDASLVSALGEASVTRCFGWDETAGFATGAPLSGEHSSVGRGAGDVGRPLNRTRVYVLDPGLCPLPAGVAGDVYIAGGASRGYVDAADATAERFVPDPFSAEPGARMFRTGYVGMYSGEANLILLGRAGPARGYQVPTTEAWRIQQVVRTLPGVDDALVVAEASGGAAAERLHVCVASGGSADASRDRIEAALRARFPAQRLPFSVHVQDELPPGTQELRDIVDGGQRPTAQPARKILRDQEEHYDQLCARSNLTKNQLLIWAGARFQPEVPLYNLAGLVDIDGQVDADLLSRAIGIVVDASDALRTVIEEEDGVPYQRVRDPGPIPIVVVDLSGEADLAAARRSFARSRAQRMFTLHESLFDAAILKLPGGKSAFYLGLHHIVGDGWSIQIANYAIVDVYNRLLEGEESGEDGPTLELPAFADFVTYHREKLVSSSGERAKQLLLGLLEEEVDSIPFYSEGAEAQPDTRVERVSCELGEARSARIRELAGTEMFRSTSANAALFSIFGSVLLAYLHKVSANRRLAFGTSFANRPSREFKRTVGCLMQVAPVVVDVADGETLTTLVGKTKALMYELLKNQRYTVANSPKHPLYEVLMNFHTAGKDRDVKVGDAACSYEWIHSGHENDKLALQVYDFNDTGFFTLDFDFRSDAFDPQQREQAIEQFLLVLDAFCEAPETRLDDLGLVGAKQRERLSSWARGATEPVAERALFETLAEHARTAGDATALVGEERSLTYSQLMEEVDCFAHTLRGAGVGPEVRVGVMLPRSVECIVSLLGVLRAGGAFVPLDPQYPRERLEYMLQDSDVGVLVTRSDAKSAEIVEGFGGSVIDLAATGGEHLNGAVGAGAALPDLAGEHLAYVIYTSGSSGQPKGVEVSRRALQRFAWTAADYLELSAEDRVLQFASINFDAALEEVFPCLLSGARLVLRPASMLDSIPVFLEACRSLEVTVLDLPTAFWHGLVDEVVTERLALPPSARLVILGGEAALPERLLQWRDHAGATVRLLNTYGPTETSVVSVLCDLTERLRDGRCDRAPIGGPIAHTSARVLDAGGIPVPIGVAGELCIGGRGLARGYRNQPALTADRFVPDPFAEEPGERLYRTGDRVRWNEDGELEFLGRLDEQVKVRGFRVEPGEIAAELRRHDAVRDAVCLALPRETGELQLIAYYALAESASSAGSEALGQEIAADLRARLPDYMVPAAFVPIESLPVTPSGKVDRKALAALDWLPSASQVGAVAPRTELERAVAAVWSEVLGVESVGVEDSFFELGGHSLLAMQLVSRIDKKFEVRLPLVELFATPTVAGVARAIEEEKQGLRAPPITRVSRESTLALSFPQQRLWLLNQLLPGDPSYNIPIPIRIHGPLDRDALERTFQEIVQRHEVLRTTFAEEEGGAQQVVHPFQPVSVPFVDLGDQPEEEREGEVRRRLKREALRGFELREEAPIRVLLLKVRDDEHIVLMTVHHIAWDGWSMHVFLREIAAIYPALSAGMSSPLSELRIQYADFARWQRDWLQGGALERHMAYWQVQLSDAPVTMLPTDALRPSVRTFRGAIMTTRYPQEVVDALSILSRAEGATLFMTLLAAFQTLVSRYTREQDVVVGTPIAGRNTEQVEPLIGFFVNTLVLRNDLSGDPTFRELLGRVRETTLGAYTHQDMPFDLLAEKLVPVRDPSLNPFFQLLFSMQNNPVADVTASGELTFELLQPEYETAKFDLTLLVSESGEGLDVSWEYNTDLFEPETIQRLSDNYRVLLQGIARQPDARLSGLPLLADEQAHYLLEEWNRTTADSWSDRCVHSLIEAQVERTPEATAVVAGSEEVSFGELNERANRLAHYLRKRGVGASSLVGICLGRSVDLIVSVLAVLKSGAAYVPLDPAAPRARLANMLEDAAVECVITDGAAAACLSESPSPTVHLEDEAEAIAAEPAGNLGPLATPSHRMYAIFTSGSTGRPKLAAVYHRGFSNLLHWFISEFELDDAARILLVSSFSFDLTQKNLYTSLITGGRLVLHQSKIFDPEAIAADIEAHGITQINCTPSTFYPVIECADDEALAKLSPLKLVFLGGEPIILSRLERWLGSPTCAAQIVNTYGPTECTDICLFHRVEDPEALRGRKVPLGGPVPNVRLYILDDSQAPLPIGAVGELCIAGEGVGQGYVNDPELTTSRFLPDPFSTSSGERLYRTGDLVRHSGDGTLEYIGRADHQVKVRGFRIEYGEIEAALRKHGSVKEAVVLVQEEEENDSWLAAYIVPEESSGSGSAPGALEGAVRRYLRSELPDYLIPASFTVLESLPLSPNGKVDRAALPVPQRSRGGASSEYVAPRTDIEALLCGVLAELLNIERVGVHDNFFELGGDSVLAIQVVAKARGRGLRVNPIHMFEHPTVEELAEVAAIATEIDAEQGEVTGDVPLLPVQRHYFETNAVDPHFFNHPFLFEIREPLDEEALRLAVRELLQHHDALRLAFEETDAGWSQECAAFDEALVERVFTAFSLSDVAEDERAQQIEDACAQLQASFDMAGPLIRVARFDLGEGQTSRLFLVIHHLVVDAVSWRILMEDLFSAYQQALRGGLVALPPKTTSFRRWAQLIEEYASSEALQEEVPSWLTEPRIADRPLPVDLSGGINDVASMAVETERLTVEESDTLLRVAPVAFRAQMNHVLLTALARALMPWLKSRAVLVELEGHGREHIFEDVDLSRTVGWFTSRFPVHLEVTEDAIPDAIEGVKAQLEALPNRGFGYGLLRYTRRDDELRQQLVARVQPEIVFNYLGRIDQATMEDMPIALAPEPVGQAESPSRLRSPVFEIISSVAEGEFIVGWSYSKNLHRSETIQGLLRAFVEELRAIITESKAPAKREYKPEDFAQAKLTKDQLAKVIAKVQKKSGPSRGRKQ